MARWEPCLCGDPECPQCYPGVTEEALEELREVDNTPVPLMGDNAIGHDRIDAAKWCQFIKEMREMGNDPEEFTTSQLWDRFEEWKEDNNAM